MRRAFVLGLMFILGFAGIAAAQGDQALQLAIFNPVQLYPESDSITGISLGLLYSYNTNVTGLSLNFGVNRVKENGKGVEIGLVNWVDGMFYGWQAGFLNRAGRTVGLQSGAVNLAGGDLTGVQLGAVNWSEGYVHGIQMGAFNFARGPFVGWQDGWINISKSDFCGLASGAVNWCDGAAKGVQLGIFNHAGQMNGLQLGLINCTNSLNGLQIGLGNYNGNKKPLEFMVLANWSF